MMIAVTHDKDHNTMIRDGMVAVDRRDLVKINFAGKAHLRILTMKVEDKAEVEMITGVLKVMNAVAGMEIRGCQTMIMNGSVDQAIGTMIETGR